MGRLVNWYVFQRTVVLTAVRTASTYLSSLTFVKNKDRSFRFAQTASISLNSVELSEFTSLRDIEKATGFGGPYREIIMKKFRIFYQIKLGGLHLMVLL